MTSTPTVCANTLTVTPDAVRVWADTRPDLEKEVVHSLLWDLNWHVERGNRLLTESVDFSTTQAARDEVTRLYGRNTAKASAYADALNTVLRAFNAGIRINGAKVVFG